MPKKVRSIRRSKIFRGGKSKKGKSKKTNPKKRGPKKRGPKKRSMRGNRGASRGASRGAMFFGRTSSKSSSKSSSKVRSKLPHKSFDEYLDRHEYTYYEKLLDIYNDEYSDWLRDHGEAEYTPGDSAPNPPSKPQKPRYNPISKDQWNKINGYLLQAEERKGQRQGASMSRGTKWNILFGLTDLPKPRIKYLLKTGY